MSTPLFSCVVPVKGSRQFFDESLTSLKKQGFGADLEVIVQDGDVEPDAGQSDALNKGFAKANGEWFFWLNADDVLLPGALHKVQQLITHSSQHTTANWIAGNQLLIDDTSKVLKCSVGNKWHDWLYRNAVPHVYGPSAFFRRELFEEVGGFDTSLEFCMDWDLWIKFMKAGSKFIRINDYLWAQRQWAGSKTQRRVPKDEVKGHWDEIRGMIKKNGLNVTMSGNLQMRLWRLMNGNIVRQFVDGFRYRGKEVDEVAL